MISKRESQCNGSLSVRMYGKDLRNLIRHIIPEIGRDIILTKNQRAMIPGPEMETNRDMKLTRGSQLGIPMTEGTRTVLTTTHKV